MPSFIHVPTLLEYLPFGHTPPIAQFTTKPSEDWVEYPEMSFDQETQFVDISFIDGTVVFNVKYKDKDYIVSLLKTKAKDKHTEVLNGGIKLPNGLSLDTEIEDRAIISAMDTRFNVANGVETIEFKATNGWVTITKEAAEAVYVAIKEHTKACDARLLALLKSIDDAESAELALTIFNSEINEGWPEYV